MAQRNRTFTQAFFLAALVSAVMTLALAGSSAAGMCGKGKKTCDFSPPSTPTGLTGSGQTASSVTVTWMASTDNVAVKGYDLFVDGVEVGTTTITGYTFSSLSCAATFDFAVDAYDAAGNRSAQVHLSASTASCSTVSVGTMLPASLPLSTGTTFYVSTTGSDANPGTSALPWRTIQKAFTTLQGGQTALVLAGTYTENLKFSRAGTASAPITVAANPGDTVVLH